MKTIALFLVGLFATVSTISVSAQTAKQVKEEMKQEKKAERKAYDKKIFNQAYQSMQDSLFVLQAYQFTFQDGTTVEVNSTTNFIHMNGDKVFVQTASNLPIMGQNGLGGITLKGYPQNVKFTQDKAGNVTMTMDVFGILMSAQIVINLYQGGNNAQATIYPTFSNNNLTMQGNIQPLSESSIFQSGNYY
ncbi:MAG: DUF4251 domain-containing protein [Bacteroidales bacterium]